MCDSDCVSLAPPYSAGLYPSFLYGQMLGELQKKQTSKDAVKIRKAIQTRTIGRS